MTEDDRTTHRTAADVMRRDIVTVDASMSLREALEVLRGEGVSGAPVLRGSRLVGVLSGTDILELEATSPGVRAEPGGPVGWTEGGGDSDEEVENPSEFFFGRRDAAGALWARMRGREESELDHLERHTVDEIMSRDVVTVLAGTLLPEVARRMLDHHVHRVLVVDGDDLVGVLSAFDFVRLAAGEA